jgi:hypothetical protein
MTKYAERRNEDAVGEFTAFYHDGVEWYVNVKDLSSYNDGVKDFFYTKNEEEHTSNNITILPSSSRTSSGSTDASPTDATTSKEALFFLDVTAASGTSPTLDVVVKTKDPASGKWFNLVTFTQSVGVTSELKSVSSGLGSDIAVFYTLGGTSPNFTFSLGAVLKT